MRKAGGALIPESGLFVRIKKLEEVITIPQEPHTKQQQDYEEPQHTIDPNQSILPSQLALAAHHQHSNESDDKPRPKLQRQSMQEQSFANPFEFPVPASATCQSTNGKLKSDVSFEMCEVQFEADRTVHESPNPVPGPTSDAEFRHVIPSRNGHVTLLVAPTSQEAKSSNGHVINNVTAEESVQGASETTACQATCATEVSAVLKYKDVSFDNED